MKTKRHALWALGCFSTLLAQLSAAPLGTAFTYQGRLHDGVSPANGSYDLRFTIYDLANGGSPVSGALSNIALNVSNGLFTVPLDFGSGVFTGGERWLEIGVRANGGGSFTTLTPRQPLMPSPYALFAPNAGAANNAVTANTATVASGVANNAVTSAGIAPGQVVKSLNGLTDALTLAAGANLTLTLAGQTLTLASPDDWHLGGNAGTAPGTHFLGTTDDQPLEFKVNNQRALRLERGGSNSVNVIGGWLGNGVAPGVAGATVAGGGVGNWFGLDYTNRVAADFGTVSGGIGNTIQTNADSSTVGGGWRNTVQTHAAYSTVGGGYGNTIQTSAEQATVGGGYANTIQPSAWYATIGGGRENTILPGAGFATIPGGRFNSAASDAFAAGHRAKANHIGAFVWADSTAADFASTGNNQFLIRATGGVGVGTNNPQTALHVAGVVTATGFSGSGAGLTELNASELISGTVPNARLPGIVSRLGSTIESTEITDGTIAASDVNAASFNATFWSASGNAGTIPGAHFLGTTDNQPLELRVNGVRALRLEPNTNGAPNLIGGHPSNTVGPDVEGATISGGGTDFIEAHSDLATIAGGGANVIGPYAEAATVGGGFFNSIEFDCDSATIAGGNNNAIRTNAWFSAIGGGYVNRIEGFAEYAVIAGGVQNTIESRSSDSTIAGGGQNRILSNASFATVGGGSHNTAGRISATVSGGSRNTASGQDAVVSGGFSNEASGLSSTVPGGHLNVAGGDYSLAAGRRAKAIHPGSFVWADSTDTDYASSQNNQFNIRATGGVRVDTGTAPGITLSAADRALLTCGWNPFTSGTHSGAGRWGMFMEPHTLALGMPALGGKTVQIVKYNENSTYSTLATFDQAGNLTIAGTYSPSSDRNAKENIQPVSPRDVLERVAALPISRWNFKQDPNSEHVGPMAQDFHAAFGLGADDKHIATVDADGVALAAIQGLNRKLEEELRLRDAENRALKQRLEKVEQLVLQLTTKGAHP
jgi:hypothetical protein